MTELKCKNCGGPLRRTGLDAKCEYCGSVYQLDVHERLILVHDARAQVIQAEMRITEDMAFCLSEEELTRLTINEMRNKLAEGLTAFMKVTVSDDPWDPFHRHERIVRGQVRVIPPDARF